MYIGYYNQEAYELIKWSFNELNSGSRIKASRIEKSADNMELKYRKKNDIPLDKSIWCYKPYVNQWNYANGLSKIAYLDSIKDNET